MAYCTKCGARVPDNCKFCPECGAEITKVDVTYTEGNSYYQGDDRFFDPEDVKSHKGMGVLSYLGILVLIPLLAGDKNSPYVKHHTNQGLALFIISLITDLLSGNIYGLISFWHLGTLWNTLFDVIDFAVFIIMIVGIVSACKGDKREIPIISKIKIIK